MRFECAVEIQKELKTRNAELPENRRMEFRIGINLGDVVEEEGQDIWRRSQYCGTNGESLRSRRHLYIWEPPMIMWRISLSLGYEYLGEQTVKNIAKPVRVYRVLMEPEAAGKVIGEKKAKPRQWQRVAIRFGG